MTEEKPITLRDKMRRDLVVRNYRPGTRKAYVLHMGYFAKHCGKSPAKCGEEEIKDYLYYLREEKKVSLSHMKQAVGALRFFYKYTLGREWIKERISYPKVSKTLPRVLSSNEVKRLFEGTADLKHRTVLQVLFGAGLRVAEGVCLRVSDIDSKEMLIRVRDGKGGKERMAMLSPELLKILREYYKVYRPTEFLFPGHRGKGHIGTPAIQKACADAARKAKIKKRVTPHLLRHSFACSLLSNNTDIRIIQELLGHGSLKTTLHYTHVTPYHFRRVTGPLDLLAGNVQ